jgi:hypothetical protein
VGASSVAGPDVTVGARRRWLVSLAAIICAAAYLVFVWAYSVNVPFEDDWTVIPLLHSALHGTLTFGSIWTLHDENRILLPNLVFLVVGLEAHDDLRIITIAAAVTFVAAFCGLLVLTRSYLSRPLSPVLVFSLGAVWFSISTWGDGLWAFQVGWYLIILFLITMLAALLGRAEHRSLRIVLAGLSAVAASFSFIQGLALWPVGLVCILWVMPINPRQWSRRDRTTVAGWLTAGIAVTVAALWGYNSKSLGCSVSGAVSFSCHGTVTSFALHHPVRAIEFLVVEIGEVLPNGDVHMLWFSSVLGVLLLGSAAYVVVRSIQRRDEGRSCLPVALVTFGLLFDFLIAVERAPFLDALAPQSVYKMPNVLIVVGTVIYAWPSLSTRTIKGRLRSLTVTILLAVLVTFSTSSGIRGAQAYDTRQGTAARLVVNLDRIPADESGCYELYGEFVYLIFAPGVQHYPAFAEAREDHLTVFSSGTYERYRREGLPTIPQCQARAGPTPLGR